MNERKPPMLSQEWREQIAERARLERLEAENATLKAALAVYADPDNWGAVGLRWSPPELDVITDRGYLLARQVLGLGPVQSDTSVLDELAARAAPSPETGRDTPQEEGAGA